MIGNISYTVLQREYYLNVRRAEYLEEYIVAPYLNLRIRSLYFSSFAFVRYSREKNGERYERGVTVSR